MNIYLKTQFHSYSSSHFSPFVRISFDFPSPFKQPAFQPAQSATRAQTSHTSSYMAIIRIRKMIKKGQKRKIEDEFMSGKTKTSEL